MRKNESGLSKESLLKKQVISESKGQSDWPNAPKKNLYIGRFSNLKKSQTFEPNNGNQNELQNNKELLFTNQKRSNNFEKVHKMSDMKSLKAGVRFSKIHSHEDGFLLSCNPENDQTAKQRCLDPQFPRIGLQEQLKRSISSEVSAKRLVLNQDSSFLAWMDSSKPFFDRIQENFGPNGKTVISNIKNRNFHKGQNCLMPDTISEIKRDSVPSLARGHQSIQGPLNKKRGLNGAIISQKNHDPWNQIMNFELGNDGPKKRFQMSPGMDPMLGKSSEALILEENRTPTSFTNLTNNPKRSFQFGGVDDQCQNGKRRIFQFERKRANREREKKKNLPREYWEYTIARNEFFMTENLLIEMKEERNNMANEILILTKRKNNFERQKTLLEQSTIKKYPDPLHNFPIEKESLGKISFQVKFNLDMENQKMNHDIKIKTNSPIKRSLNYSDQIKVHRFPGESLQNLILKKKNLRSKTNNEKCKRSPLVLGNPSSYVLIKFFKEKKREIYKFCIPTQNLFPSLQLVLIKFLWNERVSQQELENLTETDQKILQAVLRKKKLTILSDFELSEEKFAKIVSKSVLKRNEENLKCVFKYALKFLRTQFRKSHSEFKFRYQNIHMKQKNLIDLAFYTFYFGEIADRLNWPISKFFHPKVFSGNFDLDMNIDEPLLRPKTINKEYIQNLKRSVAFSLDLKNYLHNQFEVTPGVFIGIFDQYKKISEQKMLQKLDNWHRLFVKYGDEKGLTLVLKELNQNQKCKLPWTFLEMKKAVDESKIQLNIA